MSERRFLRSAHVCERYGDIDRTTLWRWMKDPKLGFPAPRPINGVRFWDPEELDAWDAARSGKVAA